jgi:hypothetical protein
MNRARIASALRAIRHRFNGDDGVVSVEFMVVFPILFYFFIATIETGVMMTKTVLIDRALDLAVRPLRLGTALDHDQLKAKICDNMLLMSDCNEIMRLEMRPIDTVSFEPLGNPADCVDREEEVQPDVSFDIGAPDELMLLRACAVIDPIFPWTGVGLFLPKDNSGGFQLISVSAFVNEPGAGG